MRIVKHWSRFFCSVPTCSWTFHGFESEATTSLHRHSHRDGAQHDFNCLTGQKRLWFLPGGGRCCAMAAAITTQISPYHKSQVPAAAFCSCEQQQKRVYNTTPGATVLLRSCLLWQGGWWGVTLATSSTTERKFHIKSPYHELAFSISKPKH